MSRFMRCLKQVNRDCNSPDEARDHLATMATLPGFVTGYITEKNESVFLFECAHDSPVPRTGQEIVYHLVQ